MLVDMMIPIPLVSDLSRYDAIPYVYDSDGPVEVVVVRIDALNEQQLDQAAAEDTFSVVGREGLVQWLSRIKTQYNVVGPKLTISKSNNGVE